MNETNSLHRFEVVAVSSLGVLLLYLQMMLAVGKQLPGLSILTRSNMLTYGSALAVFALVFLILTALQAVRGDLRLFAPHRQSLMFVPAQKNLFRGTVIVALVLWFHAEFLSKSREFAITDSVLYAAMQNIPFAVCYLLVCVALVAAVLWYAKSGRDVPTGLVWGVYLFTCASEFINKTFLNVFNYFDFSTVWPDLLYADLYHANAYRESIYNVYYGVPYTVETTGIYGHFGLFYAPFMHLFHGNPVALSLLTAATQVIAAVCCLYILHRITSKNWLRCITALAVAMPAVIWEHRNYWQGCPHRILFPLLILAFFVHAAKREKWTVMTHVTAYFLGLLAVIWNTETGIFCLIMISAVFIVRKWQTHSWREPHVWLYEIGLVAASALSFGGALLCVNLYNLACGGPFILREFFFPLFSNDYMDDTLSHSAPAGNYVWMYLLLVLAFLLLYCLFHTSLFCRTTDDCLMAPAAGVALIGLLNLSYYMNRAAYTNMSIVMHFFMLALCFLSDRFLPHWKQLFRGTAERIHVHAALLCAVCISMLVFCGVNTLGTVPKTYVTSGRWDTSELYDVADSIRESIPENTYAIGTGLTELYALNGWDTQAHFRDFPDLEVGGSAAFDAILEETLRHDSFLYYSGFFNEGAPLLNAILERDSRYELHAEGFLQRGTLYYFVRK